MRFKLGILVDGEQNKSRVENIEYVLATLDLPLDCIRLNLHQSLDYDLDILLISDEIQNKNPSSINCKHVILLPTTIDSIAVLSSIDLNISYILLKILYIILNSYKVVITDVIVAVTTLIEILENKEEYFIEKSRLNTQTKEEKPEFVNTSTLYVAGKATDFLEEFTLKESGKTEITYDLRRFHFLRVDKICFIPDNGTCAISECKFYLEYANGEKVEQTDYFMNSSFVKDGKSYFVEDRPSVNFAPFKRINPLYFHCSFTVQSLDSTEYFMKLSTVEEVKNHYKALLESGKLSCFKDRGEGLRLSTHQTNSKKVYFLLGPKSTGLDKLNNYLLDHASELITQKVIYPTHQREFHNRKGCGSLYSLFSRKGEKIVVFDVHKARFLKDDLFKSKFETLLLASEDFLVENRLLSCVETFDNAKYIYYLRDNLDFVLDKYKSEVFLNKCTTKFNKYILIGCEQIKYMFAFFKYLSPQQIIFKAFSDEYLTNSNKVIDDLSGILSYNFPITKNFFHQLDLTKISNIALEFRRLMNFYTFFDESLGYFLQHALLEYSAGYENYVWLTNNEYDVYTRFFYQKLEIMFLLFNYQDGLNVLKSMSMLNDRKNTFLEQTISKNEIEDVVLFLKRKDEDMYLRLVVELKLSSKDIVTDNEEFNNFINSI